MRVAGLVCFLFCSFGSLRLSLYFLRGWCAKLEKHHHVDTYKHMLATIRRLCNTNNRTVLTWSNSLYVMDTKAKDLFIRIIQEYATPYVPASSVVQSLEAHYLQLKLRPVYVRPSYWCGLRKICIM